MAKLINELFIGHENINIEGRTIKHPALIQNYALCGGKEIQKEPIDLIGLDLETNHLTGECRLLGFYENGNYSHYTENFLEVFFMYMRHCKRHNKSLAYWNRLDPLVIFRIFIESMQESTHERALSHYGKIDGEWDNKNGVWAVKPPVEINASGYYIGIRSAIRSSVQYFYRREGSKKNYYIWAYDIAQLFPNGLEKEATSRLNYYSKVDKSAHVVDWDRFKKDKHYRENIVLKSNELDARAVHDLGYIIQEDFKNSFGFYPKSLISQGSFARSAIYCELYRKLEPKYSNEKDLHQAVVDEIKSIGLVNYRYEWASRFGVESFKDLEAMLTEAYSGGYIEAIRYGYAKKGWTADIASAYPAIIQNLLDLRGAEIYSGKGKPKRMENAYTVIRGTITIPNHVQYHPVTVKHWENKETNIRPTGTFKASYFLNERDFLEKRGATFEDEYYYTIKTQGKKSPLAEVCMSFIDLRKHFKEIGSSSEHMAKIASNSIYGILFEAVDTYAEKPAIRNVILDSNKDNYVKDTLKEYKNNICFNNLESDLKYIFDNKYQNIKSFWHNYNGIKPEDLKDELATKGIHLSETHPADIIHEINTLYHISTTVKNVKEEEYIKVYRAGYRGGKYWNPLYAGAITSEIRILMAEASEAIELAGDKPIVLMTDSITWEGNKESLPAKYVRDTKTLGYFETPEPVTDIVCLGSGRYGYTKKNGHYITKKRGLNITDLQNPEGVELDSDFSWRKALDQMMIKGKTNIDVEVRTLISNGVILHNHNFTVKDLGKIHVHTKTVDAITGRSKRYYPETIKDPKILSTQLLDTTAIELNPYMFGFNEVQDQTLPKLRELFMQKEFIHKKDKTKKQQKKRNRRHYDKRNQVLSTSYKYRYKMLKDIGYSVNEAKSMANWSTERLKMKLLEDNKPLKYLEVEE